MLTQNCIISALYVYLCSIVRTISMYWNVMWYESGFSSERFLMGGHILSKSHFGAIYVDRQYDNYKQEESVWEIAKQDFSICAHISRDPFLFVYPDESLSITLVRERGKPDLERDRASTQSHQFSLVVTGFAIIGWSSKKMLSCESKENACPLCSQGRPVKSRIIF